VSHTIDVGISRRVEESEDVNRRPGRERIRRRSDAIALLVALFVIVIGVLVIGRADRVYPLEVRIFHAINGLPEWPGVILNPVMDLGVVVSVPLVALLCLAFRRVAMGLVVAVSGATAYELAILAKHAIGRGRPGVVLSNVQIRGVNATGLGFPSGHAAVSTAIVVACLGFLAWRGKWVLLLLPVMVAVARVYVGAHLPLDVVGGAAIGVAVASAMHLAVGVPASVATARSSKTGPTLRTRGRGDRVPRSVNRWTSPTGS
jgi:membrane-associated phospholipid phosphatase